MHSVRSKRVATAFAGALGVAVLGVIAADLGAVEPPAGSYAPRFDPAGFRKTVTHPYYPLVPGTTLRLIEKHGDRMSENDITVLEEKKVILGVACTVVRDVV